MNISNIKCQKQTSLNLWHLWCIPGHLKNKSPFKWPPGEQMGHLLSLLVSFLFFERGSSHLGIEELRNNVMSQLKEKWCKWYIHTRNSKSCSYRVLKLSHDATFEWIQVIASGSWHVFCSSLTLEAKEQIWLLKPNDGLWIPSWQFQDGHSKTRIKPMSNWLLNCRHVSTGFKHQLNSIRESNAINKHMEYDCRVLKPSKVAWYFYGS